MNRPDREQHFQAQIEEHKKILYKVCHSYCANRDDQDDLAQEILIQLWRSFDSFDGRGRFSTWMYRIALNVAISFYRRESARARHVVAADEKLLEVADATAAPSDEVLLLYQFIEGLEPLSRALVLLYLEGHSYREIGDVLGISESNVATKMSRLKQRMKQEFGAADAA